MGNICEFKANQQTGLFRAGFCELYAKTVFVRYKAYTETRNAQDGIVAINAASATEAAQWEKDSSNEHP